MKTIRSYDSAGSQWPAGAPMVLAYLDRRFRNLQLAKDRFPKLAEEGLILSITAGEATGADILDWEPGNENPAVEQWIEDDTKWRPCVYADLSDLRDTLLPRIVAHLGPVPPPENRGKYRLYTAHPTGVEHICGPDTCGQLSVDADATQWYWGGVNGPGDFDISTWRADAVKALAPKPEPKRDYGIYDTVLRNGGPELTERQVAEAYDKYRALQRPTHHPDQKALAGLRAEAKWYADRVASLMVENAPKGKRLDVDSPRAREEHWGLRYQMLIARAKGATVDR